MDIIEDANENILNSQERYFFYLKNHVEQITADYDLKYQDAEITDDRKSYPKFTKKQFFIILDSLHERVFIPNKNLLYDNVYIFRYDVHKVELCYTVYRRLCLYYGITPTVEMFNILTGVSRPLLVEWLNTGKSSLLRIISEDMDSIDSFTMLNSDNSLLRVYHRNNRQLERLEEGTEAGLPDLLLTDSPKKSITDGQKPNSSN